MRLPDAPAGIPGSRGLSVRSITQQRKVRIGVAALALVSLGEVLLASEPVRGFAPIFLVAGGLLCTAAAAATRDLPLLVPGRERPWWRLPWSHVLEWRPILVLLAVLLTVDSVLRYLTDPGAIFGLQGWLWVGAMTLFLASCVGWLAPGQKTIHLPGPRWSRGEAGALLGLASISAVTHLAFLSDIPWRFHFDEGFAYVESMRFYQGPPISVFSTTWQGTSLPSLFFSFDGLAMHVFGPNLTGVRFTVALVGAATVLPVYGIARLLWGRLAAGIAAFVYAVSAASVHYSRVSILNITTAFWWACCFYFLLRGMRSRRPVDFAAAGLFAGTSMYTYYGTRLLPVVIVIFFAYLATVHRRAFFGLVPNLCLMVAGFFVGFGPLLGYFIQNPTMWAGRGVQLLNEPLSVPHSRHALWSELTDIGGLLWQDFLGISVLPGRDTVYYAPLLLAPEAVLLVLGVAILVSRWRQPGSFLLLVWGLSVVCLSGALVDRTTNPAFNHWTPAFPVFYLALALPAALAFGPVLRRPERAVPRLGAAILALALTADLSANAFAYLVHYPASVPPDHSVEAVLGRFEGSVGRDVSVQVVGDSSGWQALSGPISQMLAAPGTSTRRLFNPSRELPLPGDPRHSLAFVFFADSAPYLPIVKSYYPGGRLQALTTPDGTAMGAAYLVSAAAASARHGVRVLVAASGGQGTQSADHVSRVGDLPRRAYHFPLVATWEGALYLPQAGPVSLRLRGGTLETMSVDGRAASPRTSILADAGWVPFTLTARLAHPGHVRLLVRPAGSAAHEPDREQLWPTAPGSGLLLSAGGRERPVRVDPFVGSSLTRPPAGADPDADPHALPLVPAGKAGTLLIWTGQVLVNGPSVSFGLRTSSRASLAIDGSRVLSVCPPTLARTELWASLRVKPGWHTIQIELRPRGLHDGLEWLRSRSGEKSEIVPPAVLRVGTSPRTVANARQLGPACPTSR